MGAAARSFAQDHYSYAVWGDHWLAAVGLPSLLPGHELPA